MPRIQLDHANFETLMDSECQISFQELCAEREKNTHNRNVYNLTSLKPTGRAWKYAETQNETSLPTINFQVPTS